MSQVPPAAQYEFSEAENKVIGELSRKMGLVGLVLALFGGLSLLLTVIGMVAAGGHGAGSVVPGLIMLLMGIWTRKASGGLKRVVTTRGSDIEHLMSALGELRNLYNVLYGLALTGLIFFLVIALVAAVIGAGLVKP